MNKHFFATIGKYIAFLFLTGCLLVLLAFIYYTWDLPQPEKFTETPFIQSTKIYDNTGKTLLYDIYGEEKREIVSFDKISDNLKHSVLTSEDSRFYQHGGVDVLRTGKAIWVDIISRGGYQGGSTLTQQLIRAVYLTNQKSISRKIKEIVLSVELEQKYSKDQIFDWYLNEIPFGENAYGAEAAAQAYFNESASDLTAAQAAALTAMIPAPSYYSPFGPRKSEMLKRKDEILDKMKQLGYISDQQLKDAKNEKLAFSESTKPIKAPDFVMYVKKYLDDKYGEDYLKEKGLKVYTTLNYDVQQYIEQVVKDANSYNIGKGAYNTAMVVLNPKNGNILAMMGSKDYFAPSYPAGCDEKGPGNCLFEPKYDVATMGQRQPGSSFKPFAYATALQRGYTANTILWDIKTEFNPSCDPSGNGLVGSDGTACYNPQDYEPADRGPVTMRSSLDGSLNIPSVQVLYLAGIQNTLQTARNMGITTLTDTKNYGLSLVLGGGDVNLLEMTSAYGVFATEGSYIPPVSILKITDAQGNVIEENKEQPTKVLDIQVARQMNDILSDNNARSFIFGANSALHVPGYQVAAKTGTTQSMRDGWSMGYTPSYVVGVWTGNNNNSVTKDIGVGIAAPMWNKVMTKLVSAAPAESFTAPDPITDRSPALLGTLLPTDIHTILYYIDKNNPLGPQPANPAEDPQYYLWQSAINNYLEREGRSSEIVSQ
jgi:membrane peptidoglycan carboxypeptidase